MRRFWQRDTNPSAPVPPDELLKQGRRERIGCQELLVFDRMLSSQEVKSLRDFWKQAQVGMLCSGRERLGE